jgi:hypothetical protein
MTSHLLVTVASHSRRRRMRDRPMEEVPSWFKELSPAQQAVLGPREGRPGSGVATDGTQVWTEPDTSATSYSWVTAAATASKLQQENQLMNAHEVWQWETQGYLIVRVRLTIACRSVPLEGRFG